jgi:hypothetical protein
MKVAEKRVSVKNKRQNTYEQLNNFNSIQFNTKIRDHHTFLAASRVTLCKTLP